MRAYHRGGVQILSPVTNFMSGNYYDDDGLHEGDRYVGPSKYDSEWKDCKRCYQRVYMSTDHGICDACANAMERGGEY